MQGYSFRMTQQSNACASRYAIPARNELVDRNRSSVVSLRRSDSGALRFGAWGTYGCCPIGETPSRVGEPLSQHNPPRPRTGRGREYSSREGSYAHRMRSSPIKHAVLCPTGFRTEAHSGVNLISSNIRRSLSLTETLAPIDLL